MDSKRPAWGFFAAAVLCLLVDLVFLGNVLFCDDVRAPAADIDYALPYARELQERPDPCKNIYLIDWSHSVHSWQRLVRESYLEGQLPLWNDRAGCGQPLIGNLQAEIFSPYQPINLVAGDQYVDWRQLATLLVAQICSLFLIYILGLSPWAGLIAAIGFSFGSYMQVWSVLPVVGSAAFSPAILAVFICLRRRFTWTTVCFGGLIVALSILSGHIESTFMACLASCAVTFLARDDGNTKMTRVVWARTLFIFQASLVGLVGLGLAACQLLPFFDYLDQSLVLTIRQSAPQVTIPPQQVLALFDPKAFGFPTDPGGYFGAKNYLEAIVHVGRVILGLSVVGIIGGLWGKKKYVFPFFLVSILGVALAFSPPSFYGKLQFFPFNVMPIIRMHFFASLLLPFLAAIGLDFVVDGIRERKVVTKRIAIAGLLFVTMCHIALLALLAPRTEGSSVFAVAGVDCIGPIIFLVMAIAVTCSGRKDREGLSLSCAVLFIGIAIIDSIVLWRPFVPVGHSSSLSPYSPSIEFIENQAGRLRLLPSEKQLTPELGNLHNITSLKVYDGIGMARHTALFAFQGGLYGVTTHLPIFGIQPATLDMLSVGWTLTEWAPESSLTSLGEQDLLPGQVSEFPYTCRKGVELELIVSQPDGLPLAPGTFELSMSTENGEELTWSLGRESGVASFGKNHTKADDAMQSYLDNLDRIFGHPHSYVAFQPSLSIQGGTALRGRIRVSKTSPPVHLRVIAREGLGAEEVFQHRGIFVGRRKSAMPRAYLAPATTFCQPMLVGNDDEDPGEQRMKQAIADVSSRGFNPHKMTILESKERADFLVVPQETSAAVEAIPLEKLASGRFSMNTEAEKGSVLIFSECYDRGWQARIDGELVDILPANVCSMAVAVPPGKHTVEFYFFPMSLKLGLAISLISFFVVLGVLVPRRSKRDVGN